MRDIWNPGLMGHQSPDHYGAYLAMRDTKRSMQDADPGLQLAFDQVELSFLSGQAPIRLPAVNGAGVFGELFRPINIPTTLKDALEPTVANWGDKTHGAYRVNYIKSIGEQQEIDASILLHGKTAVGLHIPTGYHGHHLLVPDGQLPDVLLRASRVLLAVDHTRKQQLKEETSTPSTAGVVFQMNR